MNYIAAIIIVCVISGGVFTLTLGSKLYLKHRQNRKTRPDLQQLKDARHLLLCAARRSRLGAEKLSYYDVGVRLGPQQQGELHQCAVCLNPLFPAEIDDAASGNDLENCGKSPPPSVCGHDLETSESEVAAGCKRLSSQFASPTSQFYPRKQRATTDEEGLKVPLESDEGTVADARATAGQTTPATRQQPDSAEKPVSFQDAASGLTVPPPCAPASPATERRSRQAGGYDGDGGNGDQYHNGHGFISDNLSRTPISHSSSHPVVYEADEAKQDPSDGGKDVVTHRDSFADHHASGPVITHNSSSLPSSSSPDLARFAAGVDLEPVADLASEVLILCDCNHAYHTQCLATWFHMGHFSCPICRALFWNRALQFELGFTGDRTSSRNTWPPSLGLA